MIAVIVVAITISDCPSVKPGFEWLLGISCAGQLSGGNARLPTVPSAQSPSPNPPGGTDPGNGNPGNGNGKGHGKGKGKNK